VGATEQDLNGRTRRDYFNRESVQILPRQPRAKMPEFLKLADFLALPRVSSDNVPLKLFDYMASGRPIVATRGAAHEPLLNDSRAFMSDPDAQSFAGALVKACESPVRATAISSAAQSYARQNFGWDRFVEFVRFTYCDALNEIQEMRRLVA
jgi:glycosyltransferase involved in cell wall biosynthesis